MATNILLWGRHSKIDPYLLNFSGHENWPLYFFDQEKSFFPEIFQSTSDTLLEQETVLLNCKKRIFQKLLSTWTFYQLYKIGTDNTEWNQSFCMPAISSNKPGLLLIVIYLLY